MTKAAETRANGRFDPTRTRGLRRCAAAPLRNGASIRKRGKTAMASKRGGSNGDRDFLVGRQAVMNYIREKYARFGDRVVQYLCEKAFQRGGLRRVVTKVIRSAPIEWESMNEALIHFLATEGADSFFARVEPKDATRSGAGHVEMGPDDDDDDDAGDYTPSIIPPPKTGAAGSPFLGRPLPPPHPGTKPQTAPPAATTPISKPDATTPKAPPANAAVDKPWDGVERRSGYERRAGLERRSGRERRQRVETVFTNRRFGANRRSGIQRRSGRDRRQNPPQPNSVD